MDIHAEQGCGMGIQNTVDKDTLTDMGQEAGGRGARCNDTLAHRDLQMPFD